MLGQVVKANRPTQSGVHVDVPLTNLSVAFRQQTDEYIGDKAFPVYNTNFISNRYYTYPKDAWFRNQVGPRAPGAESVGGGYELSHDTYMCDVQAFHIDVANLDVANADSMLDLYAEAAYMCTDAMMLAQEIDWQNKFYKTGVWDTDKTGGTDFEKWSSQVNSNPITDIELAKAKIKEQTGKRANTLVLSYNTEWILRRHPDIVDNIKHTSDRIATTSDLARIFQVERVLVAQAVQNTAADGAALSMGFVHGNHAALYHSAGAPGLMTATAGYRFNWKGQGNAMVNFGVRRIPMPELDSVRIEVQEAWDHKVVASELGYFFADAVDPDDIS